MLYCIRNSSKLQLTQNFKNINRFFSTETTNLNRSLSTKKLFKLFENFISKVHYNNNETQVKLVRESLIPFVLFTKLHSLSKFNCLIDIGVVDIPGKLYRFSVNYYLLSVFSNLRLRITLYTNEIIWVHTLTGLFDNANWYEREAWDTFGVFFLDHPDLRRILMDYGFSGFPFRKDFPLSGFKDLRFQESNKRFKYTLIKNVKFRKFKFQNPWWTA